MHLKLLPTILLACLAFPTVHGADIDVRSGGAVGDGAALDTVAIQRAIDDCARQGGGRVTFPAARYATGTIFLKDNVTLHLDAGAVLLGSKDIADYHAVELFREGTGQQLGWSLIGAADAKNIGIEGPGTIDGQGKELNAATPAAEKGKRPMLLRFVRCAGVTLRGVHLQSSAMWCTHFFRCRDVRTENVTIRNHVAGNNDGFDIDSCDGVQITDCDVDTGDDALCLKSTSPEPSRGVVVRGCKLRSDCAAIKCGTESLGGFEDVTISGCAVSRAGLGGIDLFSVDGGVMRNISITDITMENVCLAVFIRLGARLRTFHEGDAKKPVGGIRDIVIKNVRVKKATQAGILISGIPGHPVENVTLANIQIDVAGGGKADDARMILPEKEGDYPECGMFGNTMPAYGFVARHAKVIRVENCAIQPLAADARPARFVEDVENLEWIP